MARELRFFGGWILPLCLSGVFVVALWRRPAAAGGAADEVDAGFARLRAVHALVRDRYVKEVDSSRLMEGALEGMLSSLDDYSVYFPPKDFQEFMVDTTGEFGGLGVEIEVREGWLTIITPIEDTPAARAGVRAGDIVLKIDGESAENITIEKAVSKLRGPKGTKVTLNVWHRGAKEAVDIPIVRDLIRVESVKGARIADPEAGIGYLRVTAFQESTAERFLESLRKLQAQGLRALVVDLRFNGGGLLKEAVALADLFVEDGLIVTTKGRRHSEQQTFRGEKVGTLPRMPLVVLVNEATASASEIFSGAVRDHGLGTLVGEPTYGKGSVQSVIPLSDILPDEKDGAGIKLTTAVYLTPNGHNINRIAGEKEYGLKPDIEVPMSDEEEREMLRRRDPPRAPDLPVIDPHVAIEAPPPAAGELLKEPGAVETPAPAPGEPPKDVVAKETAKEDKPFADRQLNRALGVLREKLGLAVPPEMAAPPPAPAGTLKAATGEPKPPPGPGKQD